MLCFLLIILQAAISQQKQNKTLQSHIKSTHFEFGETKCSIDLINKQVIQNYRFLLSYKAFVKSEIQFFSIHQNLYSRPNQDKDIWDLNETQERNRKVIDNKISYNKMIRGKIAFIKIVNAMKFQGLYHIVCSKNGKISSSNLIVLRQNKQTGIEQPNNYKNQISDDKTQKSLRDQFKLDKLQNRRLLLVCDSTCLTCSSNTKCTSCNATATYRVLSGSSCVCGVGYCNNNGTVCGKCYPTCHDCAGQDNTNCIACDVQYYKLVGNDCNLKAGPVPCHFSCLTCGGTARNQCLTCSGANHRSFFRPNYTCLCDDGYFEDDINAACRTCHYSCKNCDGFLINQCTGCLSTYQRVFSSSYCICADGYYDDGSNSQCATCHYSCLTCSSGSGCLTCQTGRTQSGLSSLCFCPNGKYDPGSATCQNCAYSCLTCSGSATSCLTCQTSNLRTLNSGACNCNQGYYDSGVGMCSQCNPNCYTCQTSAINCITCDPDKFRTVSTKTCVCSQGYYDTGVPLCATCNQTCYTCSTKANNCLSCLSTNFRVLSVSQCVCKSGYYDNGQVNCSQCSYQCLTCDTKQSNCLTCSSAQSRYQLLNTCPCIDGYYDSGISQCQKCGYTCLTCQDGSGCLSCLPTSQRFYQLSKCICMDGYYDSGVAQCSKCNYTCLTCQNQLQQCIKCDETKNRYLQGNFCPCQQGYYDDGKSQLCLSCHYSCKSCQQAFTCLSCDIKNLRVMNNATCNCVQGYYDSSLPLCSKCHYSCQECVNGSNSQCTSCYNSSLRSLYQGNCKCPPKYFDDGVNQTCQKCHYSCQTCFNGSEVQCLSCTSSRIYVNGTCQCLDGTYDDVVNQSCQTCQNNCLTCQNQSQCLSCNSSQNRSLNQVAKTCDCKEGFYVNESECQQCMDHCIICSNGTSCIKCESNMTFQQSLTKCGCQSTQYLENSSYTCKSCIYPCLECASASQCLTCVKNRTLTNRSSCECAYGFQETQSKQCLDCNQVPFSYYDDQSRRCLCKDGYTQVSQYVCQLMNCGENQQVINGKCQCDIGFRKIDHKCQLDAQRQKCQQVGCLICQNQQCLRCEDKYYQVESVCYQCDKRCSKCKGPRGTDCFECQYVKLDGLCAYCEDVSGLTTQNEQCVHFCGDGQVYYETEQCDDGNSIDNDGCDNKCRITPPSIDAYLSFQANYSLYEGFRIATISFSNSRTPNYSNWQFTVPDDSGVKISLWNSSSQVFIGLNFSQAFSFLTLEIKIPPNQYINQNELKGDIPPYRLISSIKRKNTGYVLSMNTQLMYLIIIIMVSCFLTGGMSMIYNIMDLFQMISYLKYVNVQFPYNVDVYMAYMGQFNFQFLSNEIPILDKMMAELSSQFYNDPELKTPYKFFKDGYITLFWVNIVPVLFIWFSSISIFAISAQLRNVLIYFYSINKLYEYKGIYQQLYILKYKIVHLFLLSLNQFTQKFFWMGIFRIFMQSAYDSNFTIFLEISNLQLFKTNSFYGFGSFLCIVCLSLEAILILKVTLDLMGDEGLVLYSKTYQNRISAFVEGLNYQQSGPVRFYNIFLTLKKILFMGALILLYDYPMLQIGTLSSMHLCQFLFTMVMKPFESLNEQIKQCTCDLMITLCCLFFLTFLINEDTQILSDDDKFSIGWVIITLLLLTLLVEIVFDIYENVVFLVTELKRLSAFIRRLRAKKKIAEMLKSKDISNHKIQRFRESINHDLGSTLDIMSLEKTPENEIQF